MPRYMTFRFDVSALTARQREILAGSVIAQSEESDFDYETTQEWKDANYPSVKAAEVCNYCGQVIENGECGGEGEGNCTELLCVSTFDPTKHPDAETYVLAYCTEIRIENALVPFRDDGLTYYQQLAYLVREYHDLPHPSKIARRLP
jgi:hypothetical protein